MRYCSTTSPSSVEHLQNFSSPNMTYGSYWTTSVRAAKLIPLDGKYTSFIFLVEYYQKKKKSVKNKKK